MPMFDSLSEMMPAVAKGSEKMGVSRDLGIAMVLGSTMVLGGLLARRLLSKPAAAPPATLPSPAAPAAPLDDDKPPTGHTLADGTRVDYSGGWAKDKARSEDYSAIETALGQPMWVTMSLMGMPTRKVIEHAGMAWTNHSILGIYLTTKASVLGGPPAQEKHPFDAKVSVEVVSSMRADGAVVSVSTFAGMPTATTHTVTRTLEDGGATLKMVEEVAVPGGGGPLRATLFYTRQTGEGSGLEGTQPPPCAQS